MRFSPLPSLLLFNTIAALAVAAPSDLTCAPLSAHAVDHALHTSGLGPPYFPNHFATRGVLQPAFNHSACVPPGTAVPDNQTASPPTLIFAPYHRSSNGHGHGPYVLAMFDADATSRQNPAFSPLLHWLQPNLTLKEENGQKLVNTSDAWTSFQQPAPVAGSGPHRYVLTLYTQPANVSLPASVHNAPGVTLANAATNPRVRFDVSSLNLGDPIAATYFTIEVTNLTSSSA